MCGRYHIDVDSKELEDIVQAAQANLQHVPMGEQLEIKTGLIVPSNIAPVVVSSKAVPMRFGFTMPNGRLLLNARSETAAVRPTFAPLLDAGRCLIPASSYLESKKVDKKSIPYSFWRPGHKPMYFAGLYRIDSHDHCNVATFVIMTRAAVQALSSIHDRMPVIVADGNRRKWLDEGAPALDCAIGDLEFALSG